MCCWLSFYMFWWKIRGVKGGVCVKSGGRVCWSFNKGAGYWFGICIGEDVDRCVVEKVWEGIEVSADVKVLSINMSKMNSMLRLMTMDVGNIVIAEFCSYNNVRVESDVDS